MPTLLRFTIAAIAFVGLSTSAILLVVSAPHRSDGVSTVVAVLSLTALWFAPVIAGTLVSAWSARDPDARRRMRRAVVVCAVVALSGGILLLAAATASHIPTWVAVLLAAVALATFPLAIALGRTARRMDDRRNDPAASGSELEEVITGLRRGRQHGAIGAAVGFALGLVLDIPLGAASNGDPVQVPSLLAFLIAFAVLGAGVGRQTVSFRIARRTRELLGSDFTVARRTGRIIRGRTTPESPEEATRAARYAQIALRTIPYQSWSSLLTIVAIVTIQVPSVMEDGIDPIRWFVFGTALLTFAVLLPLQAVQLRRIRAFAAEHPVPA